MLRRNELINEANVRDQGNRQGDSTKKQSKTKSILFITSLAALVNQNP